MNGILMFGLTPEKRMDRNGKLVTRHIKYAKQPEQPKSEFPPVAALFGRRDKFPGMFDEIFKEVTSRLDKAERRDLMNTLHPDTVGALYALGIGHEDSPFNNVDNGYRSLIGRCVREGSFTVLNNVAFFAHDDGREIQFAHANGLIGPVIGLSHYGKTGEPRVDYTSATDEEIIGARNVLRALRDLSGKAATTSDYNYVTGQGEGDYIKHQQISTLLLESDEDRAKDILKFIQDRDGWLSSEADVQNMLELLEMTDDIHDALDEGAL